MDDPLWGQKDEAMDAVSTTTVSAAAAAAAADAAAGGISANKGINVALGILLAATSAAQQSVQVTGKGGALDTLI